MRYKRGVTLRTGEHLDHGTKLACEAGCLIHSIPFEKGKYQVHDKGVLMKELIVYFCRSCDEEPQR